MYVTERPNKGDNKDVKTCPPLLSYTQFIGDQEQLLILRQLHSQLVPSVFEPNTNYPIPDNIKHIVPYNTNHLIPDNIKHIVPYNTNHLIPDNINHLIPDNIKHIVPYNTNHLIPDNINHLIPDNINHSSLIKKQLHQP
ncbi:hypothetical protein BgiMline_003283 [Biomphalaria glabrata]|nr:hypothetical protein BgiMline_011852 [Biomphalaria glabrata]